MNNTKDYAQQLEQTDIKQTYRQSKNWTLALFIVGYGLLGPAFIVIQKGSFWWLSFYYFFTVLTIGAGTLWCLFDSLINDYPFGKRMLSIMILVFPIGLVIYLLRSRGWGKGTITLLKIILFWISSLLLFGICAVITSRLSGIPLK